MRRAFTYVEMVVVIAIIFLVTAIVAPRVASMKKSREQREFKTAVRDLASRARSRAIDSGDVVTLSYDKTNSRLIAVERNTDGAEKPLQYLAPPADVSALTFVYDQSLDAGAAQGAAGQGGAAQGGGAGQGADQGGGQGDTWQVPFYADGTSAGGGIEFTAGEQHFSFVINPSDGQARIVEGPMPDLSLERWPAGTYAKRT